MRGTAPKTCGTEQAMTTMVGWDARQKTGGAKEKEKEAWRRGSERLFGLRFSAIFQYVIFRAAPLLTECPEEAIPSTIGCLVDPYIFIVIASNFIFCFSLTDKTLRRFWYVHFLIQKVFVVLYI